MPKIDPFLWTKMYFIFLKFHQWNGGKLALESENQMEAD